MLKTWNLALTVSKLHSEAGSLATRSWTSRSLSIASLVSFITSSGVCSQEGGGWGGLRLAMLDDENEEVSNMPDNADDVEKRRVTAFRLVWTKRGVGVIKCLNPAIDLMVTCGSRRVVAKPKARPTAKRLQLRRGRRHLVTLELELDRATAYIACHSGSEDNASFSAKAFFLPLFQPRWTEFLCVSSLLSYLVLALSGFRIPTHKHIATSLGMRAETKLQFNNCKPAKTKRPPFTDITNAFNKRIDPELHAELAPPPRTSRELVQAMDRENHTETFGSAAACYHLPGAVALVQHQRPVQNPLPPSLLPSTVSHLRSESLGRKPSRRLTLSETRTQRLHVPDLVSGSSVNCVPSRELHAIEAPLWSTSPDREPLSTSLLSPKTHKLAHGQLVILPSRSILVDFREGERKKGRKGDEVMVVSPVGDQVKSHLCDRRTLLRQIKISLYSAPHLSTPCCLIEPIATYWLNELPADWYRLYEQAKKVIEHIKRNVPKVRS